MIDLSKAAIARIRKNGEDFEVLVECDKAIDFKQGKAQLEEALVYEDIYKDAKKGLHASENEIKKVFETKDLKKVAGIIIKNGEIQLTTEHRNKLREEKRKRVIELIHRNAIDSKTGLPHPSSRIKAAMEEARIHIDEFKSAEDQIKDVLEKLEQVIPIKFELKKLSIKIPSKFSGPSYTILKQFGKILNENWENDGTLLILIEIPGGLQSEFMDKINSLTHGEVEINIKKE